MTKTTAPLNPHALHPCSPSALLKSLWFNRQLIMQLIKREIIGRYKGSVIGVAWSFFYPILMLVVYTFVFSVIFKSRWGGDESKTLFAVIIFTGMIVLNLFTEVLNRAPTLITSNTNYVKKIVFPVEVIPVVALGVALFHALISLIVVLIAFIVFNGFLHWTAIFSPIVMLPLILITLSFAWLLASLGVYLRDIGQTVSILTMALMFLSPIFYPITVVPESFRPYILANPLTFIIEQMREVIVWGHTPNWLGLAMYCMVATSLLWLSFALFQKMRRGFADVL